MFKFILDFLVSLFHERAAPRLLLNLNPSLPKKDNLIFPARHCILKSVLRKGGFGARHISARVNCKSPHQDTPLLLTCVIVIHVCRQRSSLNTSFFRQPVVVHCLFIFMTSQKLAWNIIPIFMLLNFKLWISCLKLMDYQMHWITGSANLRFESA